VSKELIDWVDRQLKIKGISQRELAKKAKVSHSLISNAMRGERSVTWDFCKAVSRGLNEPIWSVLILAGFLDDIPQKVAQSEEIRSLVLKFEELSPQNRIDVIKYIDWVLLRQRS
jgi:transcriptional regulator with XRE-family HTH domain